MEYHELAPAAALQAVDVIIKNATAGLVDLRIRIHDPARTTWEFPPTSAGLGGSGRGDEEYEGDGTYGATLPSFAPVHFAAEARGLSVLPASITVNISFDGGAIPLTLTLPVDAYGAAMATGVVVPSPTLWSSTSPIMHTVRVAIVSPAPAPAALVPEVIIDSFGLRTVAVCPTAAGSNKPAVCINGVPVSEWGGHSGVVYIFTLGLPFPFPIRRIA